MIFSQSPLFYGHFREKVLQGILNYLCKVLPKLDTASFLRDCPKGSIIDVRSPGEYAQGHIPGAVNLPLFDDAERAIVGTAYKKQGPDQAMLKGLEIVGPKMADFVRRMKGISNEGNLGVYCWRGGQRSQSMGWLFTQAGRQNIRLLNGGYKSFRRHVLKSFEGEFNFQILGGYTGSGKTEIIKALKERGEAVIDLEGLANHKGSAFGALGEEAQPRTEHFENLLFSALQDHDTSKPVWLEDESRTIGACRLPNAFYDSMRESSVLFLDIPQEQRVQRLVKDYGPFSKEELADPINRISKRLGGQHVKRALEALDAGDLAEVARITLNYYDKAYRYGLEQRSEKQIIRLEIDEGDANIIAEHCIQRVNGKREGATNGVQ